MKQDEGIVNGRGQGYFMWRGQGGFSEEQRLEEGGAMRLAGSQLQTLKQQVPRLEWRLYPKKGGCGSRSPEWVSRVSQREV